MHGSNANINKPVDGTEVWNPQQEQITKNLENDNEKESNKPTVSIEDMNKTLKKNKEQLADVALKNPDMLSAVDQWKIATEQAWIEAERNGWPC
jgi:hypothetical protein